MGGIMEPIEYTKHAALQYQIDVMVILTSLYCVFSILPHHQYRLHCCCCCSCLMQLLWFCIVCPPTMRIAIKKETNLLVAVQRRLYSGTHTVHIGIHNTN